jgi:multicomponent K+:H+ antiporter subunit E
MMAAPLRHPLLFLALLASWLMLNRSFELAHWLLGAAVAWSALAWSTKALGTMPRLKHPGTILRLMVVVLRDIVMSNIDVAKRVLGPQDAIQPDFVWVPLQLRDPYAIATLAGIITMTPGTLSATLNHDQTELLVHALHMPDPQGLVADIKARYEAPLLEIFQ